MVCVNAEFEETTVGVKDIYSSLICLLICPTMQSITVTMLIGGDNLSFKSQAEK